MARPDSIKKELLKNFNEELVKFLTKLFNHIKNEETIISKQWRIAEIILLTKEEIEIKSTIIGPSV